MRLTCPNCDAQYEVDDAVIPDDGRDVQCSNCGHTWFQASAASLSEETESVSAGADEAVDSDFDDSFFASADEKAMAVETRPPEGADIAAATANVAEKAPKKAVAAEPPKTAPVTPEPRRRTLDEAVVNVLREEAEREKMARQSEGSALETQGDLGLAAAVAGAIVAASDTVGDTRVTPTKTAGAPDGALEALVSRTARRELLPDIEEINSTLRATSERGDEAAAKDAPETLRQKRNGFRRGFITSLVVMILLLIPYLLANNLAARFPGAAPGLTRYVDGIDAIRVWMDQRMKSTTESMRDTSEPSN